ncbi:MAG: transglutaminase family protein [Myxococcota bacterium]
MLRSFRFALVIFLALPFIAVGCASARQGALTPLRSGQLEARAALQVPDADDDPLEHARALARAEWDLGRPYRAAEAMALHLRRAESAWWFSRLYGDAEAQKQSRRELTRAAKDAMRWAKRADDPELMVRGIMAHPNPQRHQRALRRALTDMDDGPMTWDYARLLEQVGDDLAARQAIASFWPLVPDGAMELGLDALPPDPRFPQVHVGALRHAVEHGAAPEELRHRSAAVLEADPWHLGAAIVALAVDERAAGTLSDDPLLFEDLFTVDLAQTYVNQSRMARLSVRLRAKPKSHALRLALASEWVRAGLVGDALAVLEPLSAAGDAEVARVRDQLVAMSAVRRGATAEFEHWHAEQQVASVSVDHWLLVFAQPDYPALQGLVTDARRRLAEQRQSPVMRKMQWATIFDEEVSDAARQWAREHFGTSRQWQQAWEGICRERGRVGEACDEVLPWPGQGGIVLAGRTRHFHPSLLSDIDQLTTADYHAIGPVLEQYVGTVTEASPEVLAALFRFRLAQGRYDDARSLLETSGELMAPSERTWAWLVIDDVESGSVTFDEANRWYAPVFTHDPDAPENTEDDEPPVSRLEHYVWGMTAGRRAQHQRALEWLMPLLDELPDEVMVDGLAQAALAAHLAGDPRLEALQQRLLAVDRHGASLALLQARIARDAGLPEVERGFLTHGLRWSPDDTTLYRELLATFAREGAPPPEAAMAFIAERAPPYDYLHEDLRRGVRDGTLSSFAAVQQALRGINGTEQDAWQVGASMLRQFPNLASRAVAWGEKNIREAESLEEAKQWAVATFELQQTAGVRHRWALRRQLWAALVADRSLSGLALARQRDPERRYRPLSDGDSLVLLLRARQAGEIDDQLAWDLWRWANDNDAPDADARVVAIIAEPPAGTLLQIFACNELTAADDEGPAYDACEKAFASHPSSASVAVNQIYLGLNDDDEAAGDRRLRAAVASGAHRASFIDEPEMALTSTLSQPWHHNYAVWLGRQGRHEESADHWLQAFAFGLNEDAGRFHAVEQVTWRGAHIRGLQTHATQNLRVRQQRRSWYALLEGRPTMARHYAEAARTMIDEEEGASNRAQLIEADERYHRARWAEADLHAGRITTEGIAQVAALFDSNDPTAAKRLHGEFPESSLVALARIQVYRELGENHRALPIAGGLAEGSTDPLAAATVIPLLADAERLDEAKAMFEAADAANPGDDLLRYVDASEFVTGARTEIPAWTRDPARYDARVAQVTSAQIAAFAPMRVTAEDRAAEIFVPGSWKPSDISPLRYRDGEGGRVLVLTNPRDSRCQGEICAADLLEQLAGSGRTLQWMRETTLVGLPATQAMFTSPEEVLVAWVLPSGGRVFTLVMAATPAQFDRLRPVLAMFRDGFRPLDGVRSAFAARSLRTAGAKLVDGWRLRARREQATVREPGVCPVPETLAALKHDHQRAELLIDLWLGMPDADARLALLECTGPREAASRRLALVALLDEDPRAHEFGVQAVQTHASRADADVRTLLSTPAKHAIAAPDYLIHTDKPPRGLVEVLGALPLSHGRTLAARLLASKDARDRRLAWAGVRLRPELATDEVLEVAMAEGSELVAEAASVMAGWGRTNDRLRLRRYLESAPSPSTARARRDMRSVAVALAWFMDADDQPLLLALPGRVEDDDDVELLETFRETLQGIAADHDQATKVQAGVDVAEPSDRALRWVSRNELYGFERREEAELREAELAELLPGEDWIFARLAAPGLFASTVADVAGRLTSENEAVDQRISDLTAMGLRAGGFAALSQTGGLDVSEPIECARAAKGGGWVCSARVTDRDALLTVLGQRKYDEDAGVSLPLTLATTAGIVPVVMSVLPAVLHFVVYPDEDDEDESDEGDDDDDEPGHFIASLGVEDDDEAEVVAPNAIERTRRTIERNGMPIEVYSIVDGKTSRIGIDSERYLFTGDRLWVFATDRDMRRVLRRVPGPALADSPEFQRLTAKWKEGAALQAVAVGDAWSLAPGGASIEVVLDESGLHFRYAAALEEATGVNDIGPALSQLPPGALTTVAHGLGRFSETAIEVDPLKATGSDATRVPPLPLFAQARGVAFGWYLEDGDHLWRRWVGVTPLDAPLRKALRKAKTPPGKSEARRHGGLCYRERADFLFVGDCTLVDQAANGPPPPAASREQLRVGYGSFDGAAIAERLPGLAGLPLEEKMVMRGVAPIFNIFTELEVEADWILATGLAVIEGHVGVRLREAGDHSRVIDDWLATKEVRNAASLPRRVRFEELEGKLRYTFEVPDAEAFARGTLVDSPRTAVEVLGPTRVRLTVEPVAASAAPVPLGKDELARLTKATDEYSSEDARIVELARSIVPEGTSAVDAAELVSQWVHERISYEVTPRVLSGVEILEAGRGDCTEYAGLTVTLLRALDIPAEMRSGMAASDDEMVAHAWVGFHDGVTWHEIDPTWGRKTATSGHLEMSVLDALALISLGKLEVVEIAAP